MAKPGTIWIRRERGSFVDSCEALDCRFNAMNVYPGDDNVQGLYCTFNGIQISRSARCRRFEDCADHGETPFK